MQPEHPQQPEKEPGRPDGDPDSQHGFAGATDDFGLKPRPRVRTQRVDPLLGMDLGGVKIVRLIGEGGMGRVYEAHQDKPSRSVAVKVIRQGITSDKTMRRFEREAEFLARLQHPGIAQIFVVGTYSSDIGDVPFYVMEYIANAKPITNYVHEHALSLLDRLRLFKQVCDAVSHGHDRSIVHRDLKPGNILVDAEGRPKVIDFGVARSTDSDLALGAMKTDTGQLIGTVQYMSPEQFGPAPDDLDSRTDVYSLGVLLYEVLSGSPPYSVSKKALHEASRVVCEQVPAMLRSIDKSIPKDVSAIAEKCLQKEPRHRYHNAGELGAEIERFLNGKPVRAKSRGVFGDMWPALGIGVRPKGGRRLGAVLLLTSFGIGTALGVFAAAKRNWFPAATVPASGTPANASQAPVTSSLQAVSRSTTLNVSGQWVDSGLDVTEGACYRLVVSGTCKDDAGQEFGPDGVGPPENRSPLGSPATVDVEQIRASFVDDFPRQALMAKVGDCAIHMWVGSGLTFVAPESGELAFRINESRTRDSGSSGRVVLALEEVKQPQFVDKDGRTTIRARVGGTKYLLFRPDGLRWQYSGMLSSDEGKHATLINGIAWWPERDVRDVVRSKVLKTAEFAWAASPTGPEPVVEVFPGNPAGTDVFPEGPKPGQPALKFVGPRRGEGDVGCTVSRPGTAR